MKIDKERLEAYSEEISKICKLWGYNSSNDCFEDYFEDASYFDSIPYIKELAESDDEDDDFMVKLGYAIDEVYDSTIELTLDEIKDFIENEEGISLIEYISNGIKNRDIEPELVLDWFIKNCDDKTIQKFVNWVLE